MDRKQKVILSVVSLILLVLTSVTATFAWSISNARVYVSQIEVEISTGDGILISVRPDLNFKSSLTEEDIKEAIVVKYLGYSYKDAVLVDSSQNRVDLTTSQIDEVFSTIKLETTTSLDGKTFYDFNGAKQLPTSGKYVNFDLYFTALANESEENTEIYFNYSSFNYDESNKLVKQTRILTEEEDKITTTSDSTKSNYLKANLTTIDALGNPRIISKGSEELELYASNAARFSTTCTEFSEEVTKIYEPNIGLGSYASDLDSERYNTSDLYKQASYLDKNKSASYTYLYAINNNKEVERAKVSIDEIPFTYKDFYSYEADHIISLEKGQTKCVNFNIWLEGRDADCFDAIVGSKIRIDLAFTTKAYTMYEKLKTVNYHIDDEIVTFNYYDFKKFNVYLPIVDNNLSFKGYYTDTTYQTLFDFNSVIDSLNTNFDVYAYFI